VDVFLALTDALVLVVFAVLGLACLRVWLRDRGKAAAWSAASFGVLGATILLARVAPEPDTSDAALWLTKLLVCGLALFPYFLYRFMTAFSPAGPRLERVAVAYTVALLVWTLALPEFPDDERDARSMAFQLYVIAFILHWAIFSTLAALRLWRAGHGQPTVARRRMRLLSLAAVGLTAALVGAAAAPESEWVQVGVNGFSAASALLFVAGVVPPAFLRLTWRRPEQDRLRGAVAGLMRAETETEIASSLLPQVARVIGAQGAELLDARGGRVGTWGQTAPEATGVELRRLVVPLASGELAVWSGPQTPFFGHEELELLRSIGALIDLAFERVALLRRERETIDRLEELDELKNTFLSAVSHELRTPLAVILGGAITLEQRRHQLDPADEHRLVEELSRASHKLHGLLSDLLDLDRLTRGVVTLVREHTDLTALVHRVVEGLDLDGRRPSVDAPPVTADVDAGKVERIVENLVLNAVRHTPPSSTIAVRLSRDDGAAQLEVEDSGPGVAADLHEAIFEPFRRGSEPHAPGTGIGLSLVRRFAELHGGRAWVEDGSAGGARFVVRLPLAADG
jgi:signal transduction histidine kinase